MMISALAAILEYLTDGPPQGRGPHGMPQDYVLAVLCLTMEDMDPK